MISTIIILTIIFWHKSEEVLTPDYLYFTLYSIPIHPECLLVNQGAEKCLAANLGQFSWPLLLITVSRGGSWLGRRTHRQPQTADVGIGLNYLVHTANYNVIQIKKMHKISWYQDITVQLKDILLATYHYEEKGYPSSRKTW